MCPESRRSRSILEMEKVRIDENSGRCIPYDCKSSLSIIRPVWSMMLSFKCQLFKRVRIPDLRHGKTERGVDTMLVWTRVARQNQLGTYTIRYPRHAVIRIQLRASCLNEGRIYPTAAIKAPALACSARMLLITSTSKLRAR